jgi:ribonuclease E
MAKKMLIDAAHPEETRVAVLDGNRVEDFDFEVASKKQLRGNIYLAKVTRVEPSLQAAFVEYGGNRHGFLAFSEIHPDYYAIPHADQQSIKAELAEAEAEAEKAEEDDDALDERRRRILTRRYKIQEVIRRRQIMLVQVVKEERGNKGAALTTYLSLAGRYCVLMPNTGRGGGISRKITPGFGSAPRPGFDYPHRRRQAHQDRDQARLRIPLARLGDHSRRNHEVDRAGADL